MKELSLNVLDIAKNSVKAKATLIGISLVEEGNKLTLTVPNADGIEIYTAKSPDNPANNMRNTVILRRRAKDARFLVVFEKEGK